MDNKTINMNDDEVEIDLLQLFRALKKRILWIVGAGVIMGGAFGLFSKFAITPQYTSTSMVFILSKETTLTSLADLQIGSQLTQDYKIIVTSRPVISEVIDKLKLDISYENMVSKITINNPNDTRILSITAQDPDPVMAKDIADSVAKTSSEYIGDKMEVTPPKIIEKGEVPTSRSNTGVAKMAVMGVLAGMILCAGVIVIRTIMDDTIKSEEDIEKYLGLSTLSIIPDRKDYINGSGKTKSKRNDAGKRKAS